MSITHIKGGDVVTGDSIQYFRLCALKGMVGLECKGMRHSSGRAVWRVVKKEFNIKGNKQAVHAWLCAKVQELAPQQEHIDETQGDATHGERPDSDRPTDK